ncbi:MAG: ligD [Segetibacter sp.]|nr:ligD [Segetibacter sp.]
MTRGKKGDKVDEFIPAMLAKETETPFSDPNWIFEIKWDGYRAIAEVDKGEVDLYSRNGNSFNGNYPAIVTALKELNFKAVFDGEVVVLNEDGNPDFQKLQHFGEHPNYPLHYYIFDVLKHKGKELYNLPLIERKELLQSLLPDHPVLKYSDHVDEQGEDFFKLIQEKDMEGIMAKKKDSSYYPGKRSSDWLKIKHHKSDEAIVVGFTEPRGGRKYFGALVLGTYQNGKLTYIGHTGSGFDGALLKELYARLEPMIVDKSPFDEKVKTNMPVTWVRPELVCELKFTEWTRDGKMRHPIFLRMREDKKVKEVDLEKNKVPDMATATKKAAPKKAAAKKVADVKQEETEATTKKAGPKKSAVKKVAEVKPEEKAATAMKAAPKKVVAAKSPEAEEPKVEKEKIYTFGKVEVKTTNRTKIFFPEDGITKGDVIDYYDRMADYILPYLKDRPQSLFRTPNGINQKGFFHKDAGDEAPAYVKSIPLYSESANKDINYILCNDKATLLYLVNMGSIEINPWHSTTKNLDKPDYMMVDIDPGDGNTFEQVIEAANVVKEILDKAGAPSICKTSGSTGLHIYVPMGKKYDYDQVRDFANLICILAQQQLPSFTTLERNLVKRGRNHIYMDYLQNRKGQTIASVYSLRPRKGATVSTPLEWNEVKSGLTPQDFTIHNIEQRLKEKGDMFKPVLGKGIDLMKCLQNLES